MFKTESKRILKYIAVGLLTTGLTWLLWNLLLWVISPTSLGFEEKFSLTQYVSAFAMILPSFWLHRRFTFKDKQIRSQKLSRTTIKVYIIYIFSPLVASACTYLFLLIFPGFVDTFQIALGRFNFLFGKYALQLFGLAIGMVGNYLGQRLWVYNK